MMILMILMMGMYDTVGERECDCKICVLLIKVV
jgi:hypothetical protein